MNPERCIVCLYKKHVSKYPNDVIEGSVFYLTPKQKWTGGDEIWFTRSPIGKKNSLRSLVAHVCKKANFEGYYTNHSLRATTCTLALAKGVPEKLVMERTGHRNVKSLHEHQRVSSKELEAVPNVLQLPKKSFSEEDTREPPHKKIIVSYDSFPGFVIWLGFSSVHVLKNVLPQF